MSKGDALIQEPWNALKPGEHMPSRTTFNKLIAHVMLLKNLYIWCFYVFLILGLPFLIQSHLIYTFHPGVWASTIAGYGYGGKSTINGVEKNDRRGNLAWALSFGFPVTRQLGVKIVYLSTRSQESIGQDSDNIGVAFSIFW